MSTPHGLETGEGLEVVRPPLTAVTCLNAVARVVTPWQALTDEQILNWNGDLLDYYAAGHERHYGDPRKRPHNPWRVEGARLEGHTTTAMVYGSLAGWMESGAIVWSHGLQQFQMAVYSGWEKRQPTDLVLGILWELGGGRGLLGTHDPIGDTYAIDTRLFPEAWWMLRTMYRIFQHEPRLLEVLANSEGGRWVKEMMVEVGDRLDRGDEVPAGWSYDYQ